MAAGKRREQPIEDNLLTFKKQEAIFSNSQ